MNFYKRHLGDYARDTAHLSQGQVGAYDLLLDWYYANERPLPADVDDIYRIARAYSKDERRNADKVLGAFFVQCAEGYRQKRADAEIAQKAKQTETNREIGKRGGRPKNTTETKPTENRIGFDSVTETRTETEPNDNPSQNPESRIQDPIANTESSDRQSRLPGEAVDDESPNTPGSWLDWFNRTYGTHYGTAERFRPRTAEVLVRWTKNGVTTAQVRAAVERGRAEAREPIADLIAYTDTVLTNMQAPAKPKSTATGFVPVNNGFSDQNYTAGLELNPDGTYRVAGGQ